MKTLLFCNLIPLKIGAYEGLLTAIGQEHCNNGNKLVVVFAGCPIEPVAEMLQKTGVKWFVLDGWASRDGGLSCALARPGQAGGERVHPWAFVLPAVRLIRAERPDVVAVHFGNELPTLVASLLCRTMAVLTSLSAAPDKVWPSPRWIWEQDQQIQDPGRISRWLSKIRVLGLGVDRYLAVYEGGRQSMLKRGIPPEKITVIHNSVAPYTPTRPKGWLREYLGRLQTTDSRPQTPVSAPSPNASSETPLPPPEILLVTNGSLIPRKRIDFILRACAALDSGRVADCCVAELPGQSENDPSSLPLTTQQPNNPTTLSPPSTTQQPNNLTTGVPWRLLVIGEGPERANLTELATELGIADRVHFFGLRNDVREILSECDLYLHASWAETCTYAVTEAMAAGIPVVMTDAGAAREQIATGLTGYVFDRGDHEGFVASLFCLAKDEGIRAEMGANAQRRWQEQFLLKYAAKKYHEMYKATSVLWFPC